MADSSNRYSISGLIRNRTLSGLHAHRPENTTKYFEYTKLNIPPQFVSILQTKVTSNGYNYSKSTTISFPQPEHPDGIVATAKPFFSPIKTTFTITNPGTAYSINDAFSILQQGEAVGFMRVIATGNLGSISDYEIFSKPLDLGPSSPLPNIDLSNNNSATIIANDKFGIFEIDMTGFGLGYQTFNRITGNSINRTPIISNQGISNPIPSGLQLAISMDPFVIDNQIVDPRKRPSVPNKFNVSSANNEYKTHYMLIKNFSLGDFQ